MITCPKCSKENPGPLQVLPRLRRRAPARRFAEEVRARHPAPRRAGGDAGARHRRRADRHRHGRPAGPRRSRPRRPRSSIPRRSSPPARGEATAPPRKTAAARRRPRPRRRQRRPAQGRSSAPSARSPTRRSTSSARSCGFKLVKPAGQPRAAGHAGRLAAPARRGRRAHRAPRRRHRGRLVHAAQRHHADRPRHGRDLRRRQLPLPAPRDVLDRRRASSSSRTRARSTASTASSAGTTPVQLDNGDVFRIGQEIVRFEPLSPAPPTPDGVERLGSPSKGYVAPHRPHHRPRTRPATPSPSPTPACTSAASAATSSSPRTATSPGLHCRISLQGGRLFLTDLGSSNGSFIRLLGETEVTGGDILLMGQQLFRVNV